MANEKDSAVKMSAPVKEAIKAYLSVTSDSEQIARLFGVTRQQVAAIKAHLTMKTY